MITVDNDLGMIPSPIRGLWPPLVFPAPISSGSSPTQTSSNQGTPGTTVPASPVLPLDILDVLYQRPDIRAAVKVLTPDLTRLLGDDKDAASVLNDLTGGLLAGQDERILPLIILGVCLAAGLGLGIASRK